MGAFHTICTLLGIIGKRFQDAGLTDLCVESQVLAEGSVTGVMEGRRYNRAVRLHKLVYEALMRQAWTGFIAWTEEKQREAFAKQLKQAKEAEQQKRDVWVATKEAEPIHPQV